MFSMKMLRGEFSVSLRHQILHGDVKMTNGALNKIGGKKRPSEFTGYDCWYVRRYVRSCWIARYRGSFVGQRLGFAVDLMNEEGEHKGRPRKSERQLVGCRGIKFCSSRVLVDDGG